MWGWLLGFVLRSPRGKICSGKIGLRNHLWDVPRGCLRDGLRCFYLLLRRTWCLTRVYSGNNRVYTRLDQKVSVRRFSQALPCDPSSSPSVLSFFRGGSPSFNGPSISVSGARLRLACSPAS